MGYARDLVTDPIAPDRAYARNVTTVWRSDDAGATWQGASSGIPVDGSPFRVEIDQLAVAPSAPQTLYALVDVGPALRSYRSDDGGGSWRSTTSIPPWPQPSWDQQKEGRQLVIDPADPETVYAVIFSRSDLRLTLWRTGDGGSHWEAAPASVFPNQTFGFDNRLTVGNTSRHQLFLASGEGAFCSADGGTLWSECSMGIQGAPLPVTDLLITRRGERLAVANGGLYRVSAPDPELWAPIAGELRHAAVYALAQSEQPDPEAVYALAQSPVGCGLEVARRLDGADTWEVLPIADPVGGCYDAASLVVVPGDSFELYAIFQINAPDGSATRIGHSSDGGSSWEIFWLVWANDFYLSGISLGIV
jgi:photosystem II stability/assembly factor-like uncharacterized protein